VGARHDSDQPGPVHWFSKSGTDPDRTWRFVYNPIQSFFGVLLPPNPPGNARAAARKLNTLRGTRAALPLPLPGDPSNSAVGGRQTTASRTLRDILFGPRRGR
ncbi:MAG TPA: hypothetical protein VFB21_18405, partial [Chthonomonadaceae bacterium]|nr:hypothetical protein [Chthonomonadaceae bacterium]